MTALAAEVEYATNHGEPVEACSQVDPEVMFSDHPADVEKAKAACGRCYFRTACLDKALQREERFGVWGGLTYEERLPHIRARHAADRRARRARRGQVETLPGL